VARFSAAVTGIAYHLPDQVLTNEQLAREFAAWDGDKVLAKTGIRARRVASQAECASDLAIASACRLFESGACDPSDVDFLILCTQSPDYLVPTTACLVQDRLGLSTRCGAVDINQGCSGYVYGLSLAKGLIESGAAKCVLLVTSDTWTKYINALDKSTRTIFGDGSAATLIRRVESESEMIGPFVFGTDGAGAGNLIVPSGGLRYPPSPDAEVEREDESGNRRSDRNLFMNGPEVFAFTLRVVPEAVHRLLSDAELQMEDVDRFVFHQANKFMLDRLRVKLNIPAEKFLVDMEDVGNTVSSTIPIALERASTRGEVTPGDRVMVVGFGVGYSWAAALLRAY
jgi:3-oxoacyl-[acyl-carrier-protein] synthase-3